MIGIKELPTRNLLVIDFSCAFAGGLFYLIFFEFLTHTLRLPTWCVYIQLAANFTYGIIGFLLFITRRERFLGTLAKMNFIYSIFCFGLAPFLISNGSIWGSLVILVEGAFIAALAKVEYLHLSKS